MKERSIFTATFFFWTFIVCGAVSVALFRGKVPDEISTSNVCGFIAGMFGVVSIIVSRALAWSEINDDTESKSDAVK